jgi:hypothetical protein
MLLPLLLLLLLLLLRPRPRAASLLLLLFRVHRSPPAALERARLEAHAAALPQHCCCWCCSCHCCHETPAQQHSAQLLRHLQHQSGPLPQGPPAQALLLCLLQHMMQ